MEIEAMERLAVTNTLSAVYRHLGVMKDYFRDITPFRRRIESSFITVHKLSAPGDSRLLRYLTFLMTLCFNGVEN